MKPTIFINKSNDYFGNTESIENAFQIKLSSDEHILFAEYVDGDNGSGKAWVILEENDILYEVHGFQSSVNDMSEDWNKEETSWQEIFYRIHHGGHKDFHTDIIKRHFFHHIKEEDLTQVSEFRKNEIAKMEKSKFNTFLIETIENKDIHSLIYMLSLPEIEIKLNSNTPHDLFYYAMIYGDVSIMKVLLNSPVLKNDEMYNIKDMFKILKHYDRNELIDYLIFEYKIDIEKVGEIPSSIKKLILANQLNDNLINNKNIPKMKV